MKRISKTILFCLYYILFSKTVCYISSNIIMNEDASEWGILIPVSWHLNSKLNLFILLLVFSYGKGVSILSLHVNVFLKRYWIMLIVHKTNAIMYLG